MSYNLKRNKAWTGSRPASISSSPSYSNSGVLSCDRKVRTFASCSVVRGQTPSWNCCIVHVYSCRKISPATLSCVLCRHCTSLHLHIYGPFAFPSELGRGVLTQCLCLR